MWGILTELTAAVATEQIKNAAALLTNIFDNKIQKIPL
jgi:hypothetical protein